MKRMLMLVGVAGLAATFASAAIAGNGKGQMTRQLTGKVTSVTARSITVKGVTSRLTCATRAGRQFGNFAGKRATMTCRMAAGRLVVSSVRVSPGKGVRQQSPASQTSSSSSSSEDPSATDDDDDGDDTSATDDDDDGDDTAADDDDDDGDDTSADDDSDDDDDTGADDDSDDGDDTGDDD